MISDLHIVEIDASGADEQDGSQHLHSSSSASPGHCGYAGCSATHPTPGRPGQNIDVLVSCDGQSVHLVDKSGRQWPVYAHETMHTNTSGGRGGNGER
jgi:hypothetical protein